MNNYVVLLVPMILLYFTLLEFVNISAEAAGVWGKPYKLGTLNKAEVRNLQGEKLGEIEDFVMDPQTGRIALVIFSHDGLAGLGQKVKIIPFEFLVFNEREKVFFLNVSKDDLTSETVVKNLQGEEVGKIEDFVINSKGLITFVILSHKERLVLVPYSGLSVDQAGKSFILDVNDEKLSSAPAYGENSLTQAQAEEIYRYFGLSPYWTLDEREKPVVPRAIPLPEF